MFFRVPVVVAALAWHRFALAADKPQCFYPDGSRADADEPCFREDSLSRVCCGPNQVCSTNGLCVNKEALSPPQTFRGSCLDPDFGPSCPTFCTRLNRNTQSAVIPCGDPKAGTFCCDEGKQADCCNSPSKVLTLGVGRTFPEAVGSSSMPSMGTMSSAPAAIPTQPLISTQTNSMTLSMSTSSVSPSPTTSRSSTTSSSGSSTAPTVSPSTLPTILTPPPVQSAKEVGVLRPGSSATPSADAKKPGEGAIIAGGVPKPPAQKSSPPPSAVKIGGAAIGGVVIVTLIIVVSVFILRWRAAREEEERRIQEESFGGNGNSTGGIRRSTRPNGQGDERSFPSGVQADEERGVQMSGGAGPPQAGRDMVEIGSPNGFHQAVRLNTVRAPEDPFQSPSPSTSPSLRWTDKDTDQERYTGPTIREDIRTSDPFNRRISLSPFHSPFDPEPDDRASLDSPTIGRFSQRGSDRTDQRRDVNALDREVDLIRSRFPNADLPRNRQQPPSAYTGLRAPPTVETSTGLRVPAAALERRVRGTSLDTVDSETFQKLLFDVQSGPF